MNYTELNELLDEKKYNQFISEVNEMNAVDIADFLQTLDDQQLSKVFRMLKKDIAADVFAELDAEVQQKIIDSMKDSEISAFIDTLAMDDTVDMLEELPANVVARILKSSSPEQRKEINKFLKYSDQSAGSVMTSEFVRIKSNLTVEAAVDYIRKTGIDKETVYVIYVTDASRRLLGWVELRDLLFADKADLIEDIMYTAVISATTSDDKETVANLISKYDLLALPVVDSENRLVGIVTVDDALDVISQEATEDIEKMVAIVPSDKPYLKVGVFETFIKRVPWLLILMISAAFTGSIITHYEEALGKVVILTAFIPMLMGSGGNAGGQASVTIIRSLSLGEIRMRNIFKILWKELRVSLLCGTALAVAAFAKVMIFDRVSAEIALTVSLSLLATIVLAKLVGASLPILAKRVKLDPAVMASPFITTIVDAVSLIIYFNIATKILNL
ncbi:MAG: magnesium transporter [Ruminococcaceae bacterium]|nr:magnesium transporter [Oscillospiraceae bacterium]